MPMSFGPNDPNSLPAMLARMSPGMTPGPVPQQQLTPGFRPPGAGGAPGVMPQQQTPGMGMDPAAMAMLMMAGKGKPAGTRTGGDRDLGGYNGAPTMTEGQDANGNPIMLPNPNQPATANSGPFDWLKNMFSFMGPTKKSPGFMSSP